MVNNPELHRDDFTVVVQPFMEKVESPRKVTLTFYQLIQSSKLNPLALAGWLLSKPHPLSQ